MKKTSGATKAKISAKRPYLKQADVPLSTLDDALRVSQSIFDHYAGKTATPLQVAKALNIDPKGSQLRYLTGAAAAFGLIEGGAQAASISVTELARRILRPKEENADVAARREAMLSPRIFGDFLRQYDGHPFPRTDIGENVLEEMGVPRAKTAEILQRIEDSARSVGFIEEIRGKKYVSLQGVSGGQDTIPTQGSGNSKVVEGDVVSGTSFVTPIKKTVKTESLRFPIGDDSRRRKVFITHGKNRDLVDPIKKLLEYGELEAVVSVDRQSVSKPVPEKVMDDMRKAGAAIIHVDVERIVVDKDGNEHILLNPNVLIEIGAAMAIYGKRFILLTNEGVKLPSNLQGLYEVRYVGATLDATSTIKLLEAIKDIKNYPLPGEEAAKSP